MKKQLSLSIFLPTYNEEANIRSAVEHALSAVQNLPQIGQYEIIIVNDGSSDRTKKIAEDLVRENRHVRLVSHARNLGYGRALLTGIKSARYEYIFFTDADLQFDMYELWKLLDYAPEYQAVIGYRAPRKDPAMRILNAWGWNVLNRIGFGLKVKDIDCAFKLIKRDLLIDLPLTSRGAMFSAEMLIRLQRAGVAFKEVPVTHLPRKQGSPTGAKPAVILRALKEYYRLYKTELGNAAQLQIARFLGVGVLNTAVDFFVYLGITRSIAFFAANVTFAKFISFLTGSVSSFALNRSWTFQKRGKVQPQELVKFYSTVAMSVLINVASMHILANILGVYDLAAVVLSVGFTLVWNFTLSKFWVFTKEPQRKLGVAKKQDTVTQS